MANSQANFESDQQKRTLGVIIWIVLLSALILGLYNIQFNTLSSILALFGLALLCVPLLFMNSRGHYLPSALALSLIVLIVINVNLYDGDGILDPGLLAYPIFIMAGTLLFGKRATPYFALAALVSVTVIVYLEIRGDIQPTLGPVRYESLVPIAVLFFASSLIIWVMVGNIEKNLILVRNSMLELSANYESTLEAWAKVMEYRDRETEGHSRRLVELSARLAKALGLSEEQTLNLRRGALIHDIGKLAIPDDILLKPSSLTESEKEIIRKHPDYAAQMLAGISFLEPALSVAKSHHERWDGKGYPGGLKEQEIPLLARLFSVVDTWDALNSERVYRRKWTPDEIKKYLRENSGTLFDPHIVDVFLTII